MTKSTFAEIITVVEKAFGVSLDADTRKVWWGLLNELDDPAAMAACVDCCRTSVYPPKPADIWTRCQEPEAVRVEGAALIWCDILECAKGRTQFGMPLDDNDLFSYLRNLGWDDLETDRAYQAVQPLGGLDGLRELDGRGLIMARRDFERLYFALEDADKHRCREQAGKRALAPPNQTKRLAGASDKVSVDDGGDAGERTHNREPRSSQDTDNRGPSA